MKKILIDFFARMRSTQKIRESQRKLQNTNSNSPLNEQRFNEISISQLPEYLLIHLIHLCAHHPDFDERQAHKELKEEKRRGKSNISPIRRTSRKKSEEHSAARMKKKIHVKQEKKMNIDSEEEEEEVEQPSPPKKKKKTVKDETSIIDYFGSIFDFFFDALLKKSKTPQFPLLLHILTMIDTSYDVSDVRSKAHRYLVRIGVDRLRRRYSVMFLYLSMNE